LLLEEKLAAGFYFEEAAGMIRPGDAGYPCSCAFLDESDSLALLD
jgi:hypothetical protein